VLITDAAPLDPPGPRIVYANEAICRMSGYKRHELLGRTPRILQGAQTNLETLSEIRTALERSAPVNVELANHRRDGMPFWIELNITPVYDQGRVTHFIAIQTDITARRTAEAERHRQDASFRLLFESNPMPMWVYDVETLRFLEVNSAAIERYGFSREEFLARNLLDVQLPERRAAVRMTTHDPVATQDLFGTNATIPWVHQIASGETIRVRLGVHAIEYQGRAANLSVIWDVTEIERARDELRRKNQELASLTETLGARTEELINASRLAGIGTWSMDFTPMRLTWSPEIYMMAGRDPASFVLDAASILSCVHPEDRDMFTQIYRRLRRAGGYDRAEYRIVRPSGEIRMVREMIRARTDAQGLRIGLAGVVQDITEQKLAEDALLRSEKLKTLGQITGGIAHDFNNLLTVIGLNLETALIDDSLPSDLRSLLEPALRATERGSELTGQMLTYARRPSLRPKAVDLWQLVDSLRPLLARAVGARNQLHVIPPDRPVTVRIDPGQFENALLNLVINAQDAMTESGRVTISVSVESVQHTLHRVPDVIPAGNHALVTVTDTGQGIPAEVLPRIVEPFFTTKAIGKGSGLGLSMVYGFIHQSGGAFSVSSPPGCGTTMELYFPLTDHVDPPAVPAVPDNAPMRRSGLAVLVEDREDLRQTMHRVLEQLGFTTLSVADGEAALDILRNHAHAALLVSGMALPGGGTGAELAAAAKAIHPGLDVVLTSGDKRAAETTPTKWHLLSKPFRLSDMAEMLGRLDRERSKTTQPGSHHT
jgi:PAS domain S-box-containing protein